MFLLFTLIIKRDINVSPLVLKFYFHFKDIRFHEHFFVLLNVMPSYKKFQRTP